MPAEPILKVENLSVQFDDDTVLSGTNFSVQPGEVLAVVGPNGAGKSEMFRALHGLIRYSGKITWQPNIKIGYVPQKLAIDRTFPLTVKEFFKLKSGKNSTLEIQAALETVGLNTTQLNKHQFEHHILNRRIGLLSGGEFQRVLIAWALLDHPDVILFDEPTAGVDIGAEDSIYKLLRKLQIKHGLTIILISHDLNIVFKYADQVICLNKKMLCAGPPHQVLNHENLGKLYGEEMTPFRHSHNQP